MKFTSLFVANVSILTIGTTFKKSGKVVIADKQGNAPYALEILSGKCPNRNIISGTVAKGMGLQDGETVLMSCREVDEDEVNGRQFRYKRLDPLKGVAIVETVAKLGEAIVFDAAGVDATMEEATIEAERAGLEG